MQDCAAQIVEGIRIPAHILQPREVLIGIEDNKPQAISCCAPYWLTPTIFRYV